MQLESKGILKECNTELLGTKSESIEKAEDREKFKELCLALGEPVLPSEIANSEGEGYEVAKESATLYLYARHLSSAEEQCRLSLRKRLFPLSSVFTIWALILRQLSARRIS